MKNTERGEIIVTVITLAALLFIGISTVVSTVFLKSPKNKIATNSRAETCRQWDDNLSAFVEVECAPAETTTNQERLPSGKELNNPINQPSTQNPPTTTDTYCQQNPNDCNAQYIAPTQPPAAPIIDNCAGLTGDLLSECRNEVPAAKPAEVPTPTQIPNDQCWNESLGKYLPCNIAADQCWNSSLNEYLPCNKTPQYQNACPTDNTNIFAWTTCNINKWANPTPVPESEKKLNTCLGNCGVYNTFCRQGCYDSSKSPEQIGQCWNDIIQKFLPCDLPPDVKPDLTVLNCPNPLNPNCTGPITNEKATWCANNFSVISKNYTDCLFKSSPPPTPTSRPQPEKSADPCAGLTDDALNECRNYVPPKLAYRSDICAGITDQDAFNECRNSFKLPQDPCAGLTEDALKECRNKIPAGYKPPVVAPTPEQIQYFNPVNVFAGISPLKSSDVIKVYGAVPGAYLSAWDCNESGGAGYQGNNCDKCGYAGWWGSGCDAFIKVHPNDAPNAVQGFFKGPFTSPQRATLILQGSEVADKNNYGGCTLTTDFKINCHDRPEINTQIGKALLVDTTKDSTICKFDKNGTPIDCFLSVAHPNAWDSGNPPDYNAMVIMNAFKNKQAGLIMPQSIINANAVETCSQYSVARGPGAQERCNKTQTQGCWGSPTYCSVKIPENTVCIKLENLGAPHAGCFGPNGAIK